MKFKSRKLLAIVLAMILCMSVVVVPSFAADDDFDVNGSTISEDIVNEGEDLVIDEEVQVDEILNEVNDEDNEEKDLENPQDQDIINNEISDKKEISLFNGATREAKVNVTFFVSGQVEVKAIDLGSQVSEPINPEIPEDMVAFSGWFIADEFGVEVGDKFDFDTELTGDIYLVAKFTDKYLVRFYEGREDDSKVIDSKEASEGESVDETGYKVTDASGALVSGWTIGKEATELYDFTNGVYENLDLYPVFSEMCYVYYDSTGGTDVVSQYIISNTKTSAPESPSRMGYDFSYWSDKEGGAEFDFSSEVISTDITLYAVWSPQSVNYTVYVWVEDENNHGTYKGSGSYQDLALAGTEIELTADTFNSTYAPPYSQFARSDKAMALGTGNTVINVYFDLTVYTIYFDLKKTDAVLTINGETYENSANKEDMYFIKARFGQDISAVWPLNNPSAEMEIKVEGSSSRFQGWQPSFNLNATSTTGVIFTSKRLNLTENMIPADVAITEYTLNGYWLENSVEYQTYYMIEALPGYSTVGKTLGLDYVTYQGKEYVCAEIYSQMVVMSGPNSAFYAKDLPGVQYVSREVLFFNSANGTINTTNTEANDFRYFLYNRNSYTLTLDDQTSAILSRSTILYEDKVKGSEPVQDPVRSGYRFMGWYYGIEANAVAVDWTNDVMPARNITIFAKWEPTAYMASFYNSKSELGTEAEPVLTQGFGVDGIVKPISVYTVGEGYSDSEGNPLGEFMGWYYYAKSAQGKDIVTKFDFGKTYLRDIEVFAQWKTAGFTISYDSNGGAGTVPEDTSTYDLAVKAPIKDGSNLTRDDDKFVGWQVDGTGEVFYPGNNFSIARSTAFVARYVSVDKIITLTYNPNFVGSDVPSKTINLEKGTEYKIAEDSSTYFERSEYIFMGWSLTEGSNEVDFKPGDGYTFNENTDLYACWKEKEEDKDKDKDKEEEEDKEENKNTDDDDDDNEYIPGTGGSGGSGESEIPESEIPLEEAEISNPEITIDEFGTPLGEAPVGTPVVTEVEIDENQTPLSDYPTTGDNSKTAIFIFTMLISLAGLVLVRLKQRKTN